MRNLLLLVHQVVRVGNEGYLTDHDWSGLALGGEEGIGHDLFLESGDLAAPARVQPDYPLAK